MAIARAGCDLPYGPASPRLRDALGGTPHTSHGSPGELASACDVVELGIGTDDDVLKLLSGGMPDGLAPGAVLVDHGTGTPGNARRIARIGEPRNVHSLDAPVSGGRPAAERTLTTPVGGPEDDLRIIYGPECCDPGQIDRLRPRNLSRKRGLAVREFGLGVEVLTRFVAHQPLCRVHECVFGVLALESEPVDPRL